jgi:hypothetical protein
MLHEIEDTSHNLLVLELTRHAQVKKDSIHVFFVGLDCSSSISLDSIHVLLTNIETNIEENMPFQKIAGSVDLGRLPLNQQQGR